MLRFGSQRESRNEFQTFELHQSRIDAKTCYNGVVARPADTDWLIVGADDWIRQTYTCSSPPSAGEHDSEGTNKL